VEYHTAVQASTNREGETGYKRLMAEPVERTGYTRMLRERLRAARVARGLTQKEVAADVAKRIGETVGHSTISNWETMFRQPRIDEFAAWARAVGMRLVVDLEPSDSPRIPVMLDRDTAELAKAIDRLPAEQRQAVSAIVEQFIRHAR
jgi:transcriptional regulator with XRE-family HTH domain